MLNTAASPPLPPECPSVILLAKNTRASTHSHWTMSKAPAKHSSSGSSGGSGSGYASAALAIGAAGGHSGGVTHSAAGAQPQATSPSSTKVQGRPCWNG